MFNFLNEPQAIEARSRDIIDHALPQLAAMPPVEKEIVRRIIHASGDLSLFPAIYVHPQAVEAAHTAFDRRYPILTDVSMVKAGINRRLLEKIGIQVFCFINDPDVEQTAAERGITRAYAAMEKGLALARGGVVAVGNAPTALLALLRLVADGFPPPALVVGVPVGFVGAAEAKEMLVASGIPCITITGTRGGSTMAAAIINALLVTYKNPTSGINYNAEVGIDRGGIR